MIKLSVVIITFNEEKNIERCLKSAQSVADEIVVVDSFSTDKTKEICNSFSVKFIENVFEGHIQQKNFAAKQATYNYVLSLDADEVLSDELKQNIISVKNNFIADGYSFNRLNYYCGQWIKHSGWYPDQKLRLWDRQKGSWGGVNPHDKFEMQSNSVIKHLKGDLLHYTYYTIDEHINVVNKFSSIKAKEMFTKGKSSNLVKIFFKPILKFFINYILKKGFMDGYYGFVICKNSAFSDFLKYIKLRELYKNAK